jgi:hypothetical protein
LGRTAGERGMALGFAAIVLLVMLPWIHSLFRRHTRSTSSPLAGSEAT